MASTQQIKGRIKSVKSTSQVFAYIDGANLYSGTRADGWMIDYGRFMKWLRDKHKVTSAYLFIGMIAANSELYKSLQEVGFVLVFKPTVMDKDGRVKGNCDADMVLHIVSDAYEKKFDSAVVVTSDGDFYSTVNFLLKQNNLALLLSPSKNCSILLKRTNAKITYLNDVKNHFEYKKMRPPLKTKHQKGSHRSDSRGSISKTRKVGKEK
jgi:hypothetical protein